MYLKLMVWRNIGIRSSSSFFVFFHSHIQYNALSTLLSFHIWFQFKCSQFFPQKISQAQNAIVNFLYLFLFWLIYLITYQIRPKWNFIDILNSNMHDTHFNDIFPFIYFLFSISFSIKFLPCTFLLAPMTILLTY